MFNPEDIHSHSPDTRPFLIYVRHRDKQRDVAWRPDAFVGFSRGLRDSGFLAALPAEELKSLLYLLSFVTANGDVAPTSHQLAEAFRLSQSKAKRRLERLMQLDWDGDSLVHYRRFESGLEAYVPQQGLFAFEEEAVTASNPDSEPYYRGGFREQIIAHSRRTYARPRAEVEAMVASQLRPLNQPIGQPPRSRRSAIPDSAPESVGFTAEQKPFAEALRTLGVNDEQIESLLSRFDLPRIRRQIMWLSHRRVKNTAAFIIAAIERDYEAPRGLPQSDTKTGGDDGIAHASPASSPKSGQQP